MKGPAEHLSFTDATLILSNVKTSTLIWTGVVGLLALLIRYLQIQHDPREPPVIPQGIPYVGHLIGIFRHGLRYYQVIRLDLPPTITIQKSFHLKNMTYFFAVNVRIRQSILWTSCQAPSMLLPHPILRLQFNVIQRPCPSTLL